MVNAVALLASLAKEVLLETAAVNGVGGKSESQLGNLDMKLTVLYSGSTSDYCGTGCLTAFGSCTTSSGSGSAGRVQRAADTLPSTH